MNLLVNLLVAGVCFSDGGVSGKAFAGSRPASTSSRSERGERGVVARPRREFDRSGGVSRSRL